MIHMMKRLKDKKEMAGIARNDVSFHQKRFFGYSLCICMMVIISACREDYIPKPYGYYRITFPPKSYHLLNEKLPYRFEIADNATMEEDNAVDAEPFWINITYKEYNAQINISYKPILTDTTFEQLIADSQHLAYAHINKASAIKERYFENEKDKVFGVLYAIEGNVASSTQFFMTDSTRHFVRGSLYIKERPNIDSLAPVLEYLTEDVIVLMQTIRFKNN
ncbi:gliding motility lipoprotein GldD [Bacteroidia bacterium]|nr:gliding motility lipoprotein GldD [Bacteroidia bacterium]